MAGGKGTRLRPICDLMPKPMTQLLGKPLMEHLAELLKGNGFNELCVTLGHKPECITDYFGDGGAFGVSMQYKIEKNLLEPRAEFAPALILWVPRTFWLSAAMPPAILTFAFSPRNTGETALWLQWHSIPIANRFPTVPF